IMLFVTLDRIAIYSSGLGLFVYTLEIVMSNLWYDFKYFSQQCMIVHYGKLSVKSNILCIAREEDVSGKRVYFIVDKQKFLNFYPLMPNLHYYEIITDKCVLYFDIEYSRKDNFFIRDEKGLEIFMMLLKSFLVSSITNLRLCNIFYMILDASDHTKFSRHVIVRFLEADQEYMYNNNFEVLKCHVLQFREHLLNFVFNSNIPISTYGSVFSEGDNKYLRKYEKNVDITKQDELYEQFAFQYFTDHVTEAAIFLSEGLFVDWKIDSFIKKKYPARVLKLKSNLSLLPATVTDDSAILKFSFVSKPFSKKIAQIPLNITDVVDDTRMNDTTLVAVKKSNIVEFSTNLLSEIQLQNLDKAKVVMESILSKKKSNFNYSVSKIFQVTKDIYCINVHNNYCLMEN
ncbi:hypothetical protein TSAR_009247, partial [Trichomalopsis sarcophagae]